jgi:hypothetical protein
VGKKRTRKEKSSAKHSFLITWKNTVNRGSSSLAVKGQTEKEKSATNLTETKVNNAYLLDKDTDLNSIKRGVIKSLILVSLILAVEVVLYFLWS